MTSSMIWAFRLLRFAAQGRLPADVIAHGLTSAALHAGLNDQEIAETIRSAARARGVSL